MGGYEAIVEVRDKFKETRRNSFLMIAIALLGTLSEICQAVFPIMCRKRKDDSTPYNNAWTSLAIASMLAIPFELAFSVYDLVVNTLELIGGIESIEKAILGITPLETGFVCVELQPSLQKNVRGMDVDIEDGVGFAMIPAV